MNQSEVNVRHDRKMIYHRSWELIIVLVLLLFPKFLTAQCLDCHGDPDFNTTDSTGKTVSLYVDSAVFANSIHDFLDCTDCHTDADSLPHPDHMPPVNCGDCHDDIAATYRYHGLKEETPGQLFPDCHDCHGTHNILEPSDPKSMANPNNLPTTCGRCHEDKEIVGPYHIPMIEPVEIYKTSVHSRMRGNDSGLVATCIDCHSTEATAHAILAPIYPTSTIYHFNISTTCGRCHRQIQTEYERGVHGQAAARGETDTPICIDCHGSHAILPVDDPKSRVNSIRVSLTVCAPCHESDQLNIKYGLPTNIMQSWRHSYHGLKSTDGDPRVANCSSCHRAHLILPASDSASSISPANVQATCARCHASISPQLASIEIHKTTGVFLNKTGRTVRSIYIVAIIVIIGAMVVHWLINLRKQIRVLNQGKQVQRMNRNELWQHTALMVTFTVLAITGFAFHYSGSWWAKFLFGWPGGFVVRRTIHLVAAVMFAGTAVWHLVYLFGRRGRHFLHDIFPRARDFRQFFQTMAYDLGLRREPPRFGRFSYIEKAEYWALVWGTVVMTVTGAALWFGTITENILEVGALGVMLVIHFYEAILAGLAILIWHFYSTIFNPPVYPNNPSWYTGKMPLEMYREEHPDDPALTAVLDEDGGRSFRIAAAQTRPVKGDIEANLNDHITYIEIAADNKANIIIFPELSLTGYEPELAAELAIEIDDTTLNSLRDLAAKCNISVIAGAPVKNPEGKPYIGSLCFTPDTQYVYLKKHLHPGEEKYFSHGKEAGIIDVGRVKVGLAICADISHETHAGEAAEHGAQIYAVSVFITPGGYDRDTNLLQGYAQRYGMIVAMSNYCGESGGIQPAGRSAIWDEMGRKIVEAEASRRQLIIATGASESWEGSAIPLR